MFLALFLAFAQNVYSHRSVVVIPSFQDESEYELYEVISGKARSEMSVLEKNYVDESLEEVSCSYLKNRTRESELLQKYKSSENPAWFTLEVYEEEQDVLQKEPQLNLPCLSYESEVLTIKTISINVPDDSVGFYDATPVMKNETDFSSPIVLETTIDELVSSGLASGSEEGGPDFYTFTGKEDKKKAGHSFFKHPVDSTKKHLNV